MRRLILVGLIACLMAGVVWAQSSLLLFGGQWRYLFRDRFLTDASAPLSSPRSCEPGPGAWAVTDTENKISIASGGIAFSGGKASPVYGDPILRSTASIGVVGGTALLGTVVSTNGTVNFGSGTGTTNPGFRIAATTTSADQGSSANIESVPIPQEYAVIVRPNGAGAWCVRRSPGGTWTLHWVMATTYSSFVPMVGSYNAVAVVQNVRAAILPTWSVESNIYTSYVALPANPQLASMTSDGLVYVTWTPAAGEVFELSVRRTDDDNRWIHRCDQAGGTIKIIERNAGAETERASSAQTWTAGTAVRIGVVAVGQSIKQFTSNVTKNIYTSAAFNLTATGVAVSGHSTATRLYCWPRYVTIPGGV